MEFNPMRSFSSSLFFLVLMAVAALVLAMALPLVRHIYDQPVFLWVSVVCGLIAAGLLLVAPVRAKTPVKRKLIYVGLAALVSVVQAARLYHDYGYPSFLETNPQILAFFREMVHIVEYGFLAYMASRLLQSHIGGPLLYLTCLAYASMVGLADETVQWLHAFRVGELRDVWSNVISACIGLLYRAGLSPAPRPFVSSAGTALALALVLPLPILCVEYHLLTETGHEICDESENCFYSRFTAPELEAAGVQRAERWAGLPFGSLASSEPAFWAWEDYYLTEARARFRIANRASASGDTRNGCGNLAILTSYYDKAVHVLGVRPQDYPCEDPIEGFRSHSFSRLDRASEPARLRFLGAVLGLVLAGLVVQLSRFGRQGG